jgi:hypothetical protein
MAMPRSASPRKAYPVRALPPGKCARADVETQLDTKDTQLPLLSTVQ